MAVNDRRRHSHPIVRTWLGWGLAPAAWALHLGLSYGLVPWVCDDGPVGVLYVVTAVSLLLALCGIALAWLNVAAHRRDGHPLRSVGGSRFLAWSGLLMALLFTAIIVAQSLPPMLLGPCG